MVIITVFTIYFLTVGQNHTVSNLKKKYMILHMLNWENLLNKRNSKCSSTSIQTTYLKFKKYYFMLFTEQREKKNYLSYVKIIIFSFDSVGTTYFL